jgi:hypothetical protein
LFSGINKKVKTVQDILGFNDIKRDMILIDKFEFRMAIECKKVNLKSLDDEELEEVVNELKTTLNLLKIPSQWWRIARVTDIEPYIKEIDQKTINETDEARKRFLPFYKNHIEYETSTKKLMSNSVYLIIGFRLGSNVYGEINKSIKETAKMLLNGIVTSFFPKKNFLLTMTEEERLQEVSKVFNDIEVSIHNSLLKINSGVRRLHDDELYQIVYNAMRREMAIVQRWGNIPLNGIPISVRGGVLSDKETDLVR